MNEAQESDGMSEAREVLEHARARVVARAAGATTRVDYAQLNRIVRRQKVALTRARNSGDPEKVVLACRDAVREWNKEGMIWPDDWALWQRALDDILPWHAHVELEDLR